ncbi:hypothetical protein AHAS_Ahas09G0135200 [Arachis hypogaea]
MKLPQKAYKISAHQYLYRKACENIKNPNFLPDFKGLIYNNNDCIDFDRRWEAILNKHNLVGNTWMEKTYEIRTMWSHSFLGEKFFGYIGTTSQCEEGWALNTKILSTVLDKVEFSMIAVGGPTKDQRVEVDRTNNLFSYSCKLFESRGIPCSHIFCSMKFENLLEFSKSLFYKRWTKNAKNDCTSTTMAMNEDVEKVLKFRVGALACNCNKLGDIACKNVVNFDKV